MIDIVYTQHAETRMQQRGIRERDVPFIVDLGTQVDDETWILLKRDVAREIDIRKREIQKLERLENCKVVMFDQHLITVYPSRPADQKRTLRRARQKGLVK
ncbi:MAG: hypothetical protein OXH50_01140 [Gemmatimonadetes bacterium]|nr:hypothetical protein [Gemmatimonadota bacterium]